MDILIKKIIDKGNVTYISQVGQRAVLAGTDSNDKRVLTFCEVHKKQQSAAGTEKRIVECSSINGSTVGSLVLLDPSGTYVFASCSDDSQLAVFRFDDATNNVSATETVDLPFKSSLYKLHSIGKSHSFVAAVSSTGEIALFHTDDNFKIEKKKLSRLDIQDVLSTCLFGDEYLVTFAIREENLVFIAMRIVIENGFDSMSITVSNPVALPMPLSATFPVHSSLEKGALLGASIHSHCAVMLFADGTVNIVAPTQPRKPSFSGSLRAWFPSDSVSPSQANQPVSSIQTMVLARRPISLKDELAKTGSSERAHRVGDVANLGDHYVAIAYGKCVSVWDTMHYVGHGYTTLATPVNCICAERGKAYLTVADSHAVHYLEFPAIVHGDPPTLLDTIHRRQSCKNIEFAMRAFSEASPIRAHAHTVAPIKAAADAGGDVAHLFSRALRLEQERELREVQSVFDRSVTPDANALLKLAEHYILPLMSEINVNSRSKTKTRNDSSLSRVHRLPSDRFAAAFVARCLYEMTTSRNTSFAVPLIDMVHTGVVSSFGVLSAFKFLSARGLEARKDSVDMTPVAQLVTYVDGFFNVSEAWVMAVIDVPEEDLIHIMQYALRLYLRPVPVKHDESKEKQHKPSKLDEKLVTAAKARQLLEKCFMVGLDKDHVTNCISSLPVDEIIALLDQLGRILTRVYDVTDINVRHELKRRATVASTGVKAGQLTNKEMGMEYRGRKYWLNCSERQDAINKSWVEGCVEWIECIIDAHFSNLVIYEDGQRVTKHLLEIVRRERERAELICSLEGISDHISDRRELPSKKHAMYRVRKQRLPQGTGLV